MHCRLRLDPSTWRSKPGTRFCCLSSLFWNGFKVMTWCKLDTVSFRLSIPGYLEASLPATEKAVQVKNIVICGLTFLATCLTTSTPSLPLISNSLDILPWSTWERLAAIARWANSCRKRISKDKTRPELYLMHFTVIFPSINERIYPPFFVALLKYQPPALFVGSVGLCVPPFVLHSWISWPRGWSRKSTTVHQEGWARNGSWRTRR